MTRAIMTLAIVVAAALSAAACTEVECGDGTHQDGDECRVSLEPECGPCTELQGGRCVPVEGGADCGPGTHLESGSCVSDVGKPGNSGRWNSLALSAPPMLAGVANPLLAGAFSSGDSLLFVGAYEPNETTLRIYGGGGVLEANGTYTLDRIGAFDVAATDDGVTFESDPFTLVLLLGSEPFVLEDARLYDGVLADIEGVAIVGEMQFTGVLTPEAAAAIYVEQAMTTLDILLVVLGEVPDVDFDGDGTDESYTVTGLVTTEIIWLF